MYGKCIPIFFAQKGQIVAFSYMLLGNLCPRVVLLTL
jgi:hypothetical protein